MASALNWNSIQNSLQNSLQSVSQSVSIPNSLQPNSMVDSFKRLVGNEPQPPREQSMWEDFNDSCSLSRAERLWGFAGCFVGGMLMTFLSTMGLPAIVLGRPEKFAIPYTIGNLLSLGSTAFLTGPWKQLQNMFAPVRAVASIIYWIAMILTLVAAFTHRAAIIVILLIIFQFFALLWYCMSYIPFARQLISSGVSRVVGV